jgi:glutathione S-transferase
MEVDKDVFGAFAFFGAILTVKMILMSLMTPMQRFKTMTFISSEDVVDPDMKKKGAKVISLTREN